MAKSKSTQKPVEELSYEEALAELEQTVEALEGEQNPLDESMKLYERGQALAARCSILLEAAQLKVQKLAGESVLDFDEETE
ncbi:MAG: exodeoxyribonuclease VII small subunit [Anaerolineales bacterium]|jgi:exodeoxyribonuclease VII small subunit|uniref:exodeoxyribonuclease VII small subunit n=1 Tax=Candidatus Villigracilis vicinus TaxID=3140679 RepID=UPI0031374D35|nr:exodeoxyribonuclease VII small subunit [Anaerolineales bacterium]MBK7449573.1 exodeoxyribonuclease VII small subunit [Anaerolineales bacterium]MBK9779193.1 exodeoxyribonuclease VII small subunit [Anaerolineales bacterium]